MDPAAEWVGIIVGLGLSLLALVLWRVAPSGAPGDSWIGAFRERVCAWIGCPSRDEVALLGQRLDSRNQGLAERLAHVEHTIIHQGRHEPWAAHIHRRLSQLEAAGAGEKAEESSALRVPRVVLRLGIRMTVSDLIQRELGVEEPWDLSDYQIDRLLQGPFCRHCLRSLVARDQETGERFIRPQCRHCSLPWRVDRDPARLPLTRFKRELYEMLDTEYRTYGSITLREER